jgi:hypothetical protein
LEVRKLEQLLGFENSKAARQQLLPLVEHQPSLLLDMSSFYSRSLKNGI